VHDRFKRKFFNKIKYAYLVVKILLTKKILLQEMPYAGFIKLFRILLWPIVK